MELDAHPLVAGRSGLAVRDDTRDLDASALETARDLKSHEDVLTLVTGVRAEQLESGSGRRVVEDAALEPLAVIASAQQFK